MREILQQKEKILHQIAKEIPVHEITTPKIKKVLREMQSALKRQDDGVAIAAPQIGYGLRVFVVSGKIFSGKGGLASSEEISRKIEAKEKTRKKIKDKIFINPKISKLSQEKEWMPEGCLSVRWLYGQTFRHKKTMVTAYDENGKKFVRGASGLLAQIFQHETDHLNGILFTDHAKDIKEEIQQRTNIK